MTVHRLARIALCATVASSLWGFDAGAEPKAAPPEGEKTTQQHVQETTREAADAVVGAGENVSGKIQGKREKNGELVPGVRTNTGRGYGPAGCGLGSILFEPDSGFTQIFAATSNSTFGTQTFGITSGTSNCSPRHSGSGATRAFVETNRGALSKDIARGQGETITSLSRLAGCAEPARVALHLQRRFDAIFPSPARSDREVSAAVVALLRSEPSLDCRDLS
jgi:hypothetical protein